MQKKDKQPIIIAFEGIDGSGKSIQFKMLSDKLISMGNKCVSFSFPVYESFFGKEIGLMLSGKNSVRADVVDSKSMALWYALDRWKCFNETDYLNADYLLINRYSMSNAIYQGIRQKDLELQQFANFVYSLEHDELGLPKPDFYIIFDVDDKISKSNVIKKGFREYTGNDPDVYERSNTMMQTVRNAYLDMAAIQKNAHVIECMENDVMLAPEKIHEIILSLILTTN